MPDSRSISSYIAGAVRGESAAQNALWQAYFERLVRLARRQLDARQRRVSDDEDVAISVFESFFRAAQAGRFPDLADRDDLWRLLLRMTVRKAIDQRRRQRTQKHGGGNVRGESIFAADDKDEIAGIDLVLGKEPTPQLALQVVEELEQLLGKLPNAGDRRIALAKLEGYTNADVAEQLNCSIRNVEHRLKLIRVKWSRVRQQTDA